MQPVKAMMENPRVVIGCVDRVAMMVPNIVMKYETKAAGFVSCAFIALSKGEASVKDLALSAV